MRKSLEFAVKRKARRNNLRISVWQALAIGSAAFLLFGPILSSRLHMPALSFCFGSPILSLSHLFVPALLSRPLVPALLSPLLVPASLSPPVSALSSLSAATLASRSMLSLAPTQLTSSAFRIFQ